MVVQVSCRANLLWVFTRLPNRFEQSVISGVWKTKHCKGVAVLPRDHHLGHVLLCIERHGRWSCGGRCRSVRGLAGHAVAGLCLPYLRCFCSLAIRHDVVLVPLRSRAILASCPSGVLSSGMRVPLVDM